MNRESTIPCYTIYDSVKEALALNEISIPKYLPSYLIAAKQAYRKLFWNTLYVTGSIWLPVKDGDPYPYVDVPADASRILYVGRDDHCGDIKPLFYNSRMNVVAKPKEKKCGCDDCNCSGLCEDLYSSQFTTNILFTINGVDYIEKTWIKYNKNGDVIEYKEVPTKQYNSFTGDAGDFNNDFGNDYSGGGNGLGNFSIVTKTFQRKLCALETLPCGCPKDTPENEENVRNFCSCYMPYFGHRRHHHCEKFLSDTNNDEYGEVKLSQCQTKIYFKPTRRHHHHRDEKRIPDFLLVGYQTNGDPQIVNQQIQIPEYSKDAMWAGMFYYKKKHNPKYSGGDRQEAKWMFNDEINQLIGFLSPLNLQDLADIQDSPVLW